MTKAGSFRDKLSYVVSLYAFVGCFYHSFLIYAEGFAWHHLLAIPLLLAIMSVGFSRFLDKESYPWKGQFVDGGFDLYVGCGALVWMHLSEFSWFLLTFGLVLAVKGLVELKDMMKKKELPEAS